MIPSGHPDTASAHTLRVRRWRRVLRLTAVLLMAWFLTTFVMAYFARDLSHVELFGWPLSFYMAAQGSLIVYGLIVWIYARLTQRLDMEHGVAEEDC